MKAKPIIPEAATVPPAMPPAEDIRSSDDEDIPIVHANRAYTAIVEEALDQHLNQSAAYQLEFENE